MVELAERNAQIVLDQDRERIKREEGRTVGAVKEIARWLNLPSIDRIEAYDISNISGFQSVGSMIVYEKGKPKRADYRKFKIKSVEGPNDYASMKEVLSRRFLRGIQEDSGFERLPDLIMMDGGRGQVNIALEVLEEMDLAIPVCGMVKDDKHRTRGLYFRNVEIPIDRNSEGFKLITRVQDEAHRFAIEYHRLLRSKGQVRSILDDIPGIGPTRRKELMRHFQGIDETDLKRRRIKSEDRKMKEIEMTKMVEEMDLRNLTPEVDMTDLVIATPDINRPALQLTGYYEHFANERVQIIGYVEFTYLQHLEESERVRAFEEFVSRKIPCVIFTTKMIPGPEILELCNRYQVPAFAVDKSTSVFMAEIIRWLNVQLAPMISIHGVLVDVFGEGVLIMGESGIGKSEAALELIKRGHRLVSDDVVEISRVSDITLVGTAPDITRHFIELRGIGIIDVKTLFGVESVKDTQSIDLVIKLEEWDKEKEYDRLGLEEEYIEFLGNKVVCHSLPIRPGRNLAIIVETAAVNHRQKKMGYNAAQELYRRVQANLVKKREEK